MRVLSNCACTSAPSRALFKAYAHCGAEFKLCAEFAQFCAEEFTQFCGEFELCGEFAQFSPENLNYAENRPILSGEFELCGEFAQFCLTDDTLG